MIKAAVNIRIPPQRAKGIIDEIKAVISAKKS